MSNTDKKPDLVLTPEWQASGITVNFDAETQCIVYTDRQGNVLERHFLGNTIEALEKE